MQHGYKLLFLQILLQSLGCQRGQSHLFFWCKVYARCLDSSAFHLFTMDLCDMLRLLYHHHDETVLSYCYHGGTPNREGLCHGCVINNAAKPFGIISQRTCQPLGEQMLN